MKNNTSKPPHPPSTLTKSSIIHLPVAHHNQHHYIDIIPEGRRRKCDVCADRNNTFRKSRISTWCSTCVVGLCVGDCFRKLHAGQAFSIQSCRSCYVRLCLCQRPFYKIFVKFRNSKQMYLKLF